MHVELEKLLEMQDLHTQRKALEEGDVRELESNLFEMSIDQAVEAIEGKIRELESTLAGSVQDRYRRIIGARQRAVVPVLGGICYGCFTAVPTSWSGGADPNDVLSVCEHCGRFLYYPR